MELGYERVWMVRVRMTAGIIADLLIAIHFAFILFVVLGGLLVLKWRKVAIFHIPSALWGGLVELGGWRCPLTPLERHFREAAGGAGYAGGFIEQYLMPIVYPEALTRETQIALGILVLVINLWVYGLVLVHRSR